MKQLYTEEQFAGFKDRNSGARFSNLEFRKCSFVDCSISLTYEPLKRSVVNDVTFFDCEENNSHFGPVILEDVLVDGLKTSDLVIVAGAALRHVTLRGKIDRLMFGQIIPPAGIYKENRDKIISCFDQANAEYYQSIDWALDISEAEFRDFDVRGIPSRLIRRDSFTQAVVKREKVLDGEWRKLDLTGTWWPVSLEMLEKSNWEDDTLVAPKRHRQFSQALKGIYILREAGIAEPD